ncbi:DUF1622 domain-containing protein [Deinococcus arcticus]|uniref:DUF1622 domain-containing protein n=1 Tax=Deinococcus arcticus TaxID=2136176 RepID=UPI000D15944C
MLGRSGCGGGGHAGDCGGGGPGTGARGSGPGQAGPPARCPERGPAPGPGPLAVGLEFTLAADILRTVIAPCAVPRC